MTYRMKAHPIVPDSIVYTDGLPSDNVLDAYVST